MIEHVCHEARVALNLKHQNVVALMGACVCPPVFCLIFEFCSHGNLRQVLDTPSMKLKLTPAVRVGLALDVAKGCAFLHRKHVIHRDLKPDNVFLSITAAKPHQNAHAVHVGGRAEYWTAKIGSPLFCYCYFALLLTACLR